MLSFVSRLWAAPDPVYSVHHACSHHENVCGHRALDGGQLLAAAAASHRDSDATHGEGMARKGKHRHKDKKKSKHKDRTKDAALKTSAKQLKASIAAMRAEREAREAAERAREKHLLRRNLLA